MFYHKNIDEFTDYTMLLVLSICLVSFQICKYVCIFKISIFLLEFKKITMWGAQGWNQWALQPAMFNDVPHEQSM